MSKFETLVDLFHAAIKTYPDNQLFGTKKNGTWEWITYLEFGKLVDQFRAGLSEIGIQRGDRICFIANNRVEWAVAAYACCGLGASYVPMYEAQHPKDWSFIAKDCEAKAVLCATDAIVEKMKEIAAEVPSLEHIISLDPKTKAGGKVKLYKDLLSSKKVPTIKPSTKDTACFIYTSGTTGNPKGVILSHGNIASNVSAMHEVFPMSAMDRSLSFLPWAHSFGQTVELHGLFSMGASLAICEAVDKIIDNLAETQPTLLFSVPRIFNKLYSGVQKTISEKPEMIQKMVKSALATRAKQRSGGEVSLGEGLVLALTDKVVFSKVRARFGGKLKYAFSGGAAISKEVAEFIDGLGITVYEGYGLTETSPIATANCPGARKIGSVGRAIPGVRIEIDKAATGDEKNGEIVVYGHNVMQGYHGLPEENEKVFTKDGGFRTGDMGYLDAEGFLYLIDRKKDMIDSGGVKVYPKDIEEIAARHPAVREVAVFGVPDEKWGETPLAAVVLRQPGAVSAEALRDWINERVGARYQRVSGVTILDDFPRSAAGKTLKRELRDPYWAGRDKRI